MIADGARTDAYAAALERVITPESVVLDIGTGTGIAALIAARLGARRVFAVDPSPVIELARQAALDNGYADRIEFFEASSLDIELPEPADLAVADLHGVLPHHGAHLRVLEDARLRLLAPGATLIPDRDELWAALAEAAAEVVEDIDVWRTHSRGFDLEAARTCVVNDPIKLTLDDTSTMLGDPQLLAVLDYAAGPARNLSAATTFTARRSGRLNGLYVWFRTVLLGDLGFSNAPGARPASVYGQMFFPIADEVAVEEGDEVAVDLAANLVAERYVYSWKVRIGPEAEPRASFRQSTFAAVPLSTRMLHTADLAGSPRLSREGQLARRMMELMDGTRTLTELANEATVDGISPEQALALATRLSQKYGE
jgi:SAM-dependent methyltransferase